MIAALALVVGMVVAFLITDPVIYLITEPIRRSPRATATPRWSS